MLVQITPHNICMPACLLAQKFSLKNLLRAIVIFISYYFHFKWSLSRDMNKLKCSHRIERTWLSHHFWLKFSFKFTVNARSDLSIFSVDIRSILSCYCSILTYNHLFTRGQYLHPNWWRQGMHCLHKWNFVTNKRFFPDYPLLTWLSL